MTQLTIDAPGWTWTRPPARADPPESNTLQWTCGPDSDLWRLTAGGPIKHSAHAYVTTIRGDFVMEGTFSADLETRYDQIGLVVIEGPESWLKTGFELEGGETLVGAVHTEAYSDWSCAPSRLPGTLRVERREGTIEIHYLEQPDRWRMIRQLYLDADVQVGPYSAAPLGQGFLGRVSEFALTTA